MKTKTIVGLLAIFLAVACLATVYAVDIDFDSMKIPIDTDDFKVTSSNDTTVVLENDDHKQKIIISSEINSEDAAKTYLTSQGFTYKDTLNGHKDVSGDQTGSFDFKQASFTKDNGAASAYILTKDGKNYCVIAMNNDLGDDTFEFSDVSEVAEKIVQGIMLFK